MNDEERIAQFVALFLETMGAAPSPGVPLDMRAGEPDADGWMAWRAIPSRITTHDLNQIEVSIGLRLPNLFKCYCLYRCLLMTDLGLISLPEIPSDRPLKDLVRYVQTFNRTPFLQSRSLFPFAKDSRTGELLCFDLSGGDANLAPVRLADPERYGDAAYEPPVRNQSFASLLDDLVAHLRSYG